MIVGKQITCSSITTPEPRLVYRRNVAGAEWPEKLIDTSRIGTMLFVAMLTTLGITCLHG